MIFLNLYSTFVFVNFFQSILKFYINSSLHVAFAVVAFTLLTCIEFDLDIDFYLLLFVFSSTVVAYNFVKYYTIFNRLRFSFELKLIKVLSFLFLGILIFCIFHLRVESVILFLILGLLTLLYTLPLLPQAKTLRDISGLKIFIIALVWTGTTVYSPFVQQGVFQKLLGTDLWWYGFSRFLLVIALTIPFEIRDYLFDKSDLKTLPQIVGIKLSKVIGLLLCIVSLLSFYIGMNQINWSEFVVFFIVIVLIIFASPQKSVYYTAFWIESVPIIWLLLVYWFIKGLAFNML